MHRPLKRAFPIGLPPNIILSHKLLLLCISVLVTSAQVRHIRRQQLGNSPNVTNSNATTVLCEEPHLQKTGALTLIYNYKVETLPLPLQTIPETLKLLESAIVQQLATDFLVCSSYSFTTSSVSRFAASDIGIIGFDSSPTDLISNTSTFLLSLLYL